jgi:hypothetical protein
MSDNYNDQKYLTPLRMLLSKCPSNGENGISGGNG